MEQVIVTEPPYTTAEPEPMTTEGTSREKNQFEISNKKNMP